MNFKKKLSGTIPAYKKIIESQLKKKKEKIEIILLFN
jgi:hypothetical protein